LIGLPLQTRLTPTAGAGSFLQCFWANGLQNQFVRASCDFPPDAPNIALRKTRLKWGVSGILPAIALYKFKIAIRTGFYLDAAF
jgi:hypothetical protein